jgi:hypothetical protein
VTDGTSIPSVDLRDVLACHFAAQADVTVLAHRESGRPVSSGAQQTEKAV